MMEKILLKKSFEQLNIHYNEYILDKFIFYLDLFEEWNSVINLSSIKGRRDIIVKHFIDSISPAGIFSEYITEDNSILDLGTGGGFPGIPLKILNSDWNIDLAEVKKKKISFLENIIYKLELGMNIIDSSQSKINKKYDIIISRAFGKLNKNVVEARRYANKKNYLFIYKGKFDILKNELSREKISAHTIENVKVPYLNAERNILILKDI